MSIDNDNNNNDDDDDDDDDNDDDDGDGDDTEGATQEGEWTPQGTVSGNPLPSF